MVSPKFVPDSFWNYTEACELVGAKYPAAPLGLITVAAMLPKHWDIRLVNRNTESLTDADIDWADLIMTGGMLEYLSMPFGYHALLWFVIAFYALAMVLRGGTTEACPPRRVSSQK